MKKDKKGFLLFDFNRDGKGVNEKEDRTPNLKFFFKQWWRKMSKLLTLNFLMVFQIIPIIVAFFIFFTGPTTPTQTSPVFAPLYGANIISEGSPVNSLLLAINNQQFQIPVYNTPVMYVIIGLGAFLVLTFGWQNIGATYVLRGLVRGDAVFIVSDFFHGIKKNFKQGFLLGLIDALVIGVLVIDFIFFMSAGQTLFINIMYFIIFGICIIYFFMRFYLYLLAITFELKIKKIIKNSFIFSMLGIKRNLMATIGVLTLIAINFLLYMLLIPIGIIVPLILPLVYLLPFANFMTTYAAYPVLEKYMISPYEKENNNTETNIEE